VHTARIIGPGRAGCSLSLALGAAGWRVGRPLGPVDDHRGAATGVDLLVVATPDDAVEAVAAGVRPSATTVVAHLSGSLGLDVLDPHPRRASLHPLVPLPTPEIGARRLLGGATFAVSGDPLAARVAADLGGRAVVVADEDRAAYHAAASIAANHVVALLGQVERVAAGVGLGLDAFLGLTAAALEDVARLGPERALTGPAARGDWATLARHRDALAAEERPGYHAGVALALRLAAGAPAAPVTAGHAGAEPDEPVDEVPEVRVPGSVLVGSAAGAR